MLKLFLDLSANTFDSKALPGSIAWALSLLSTDFFFFFPMTAEGALWKLNRDIATPSVFQF